MIVQELVATLGLDVDQQVFRRADQLLHDLGKGLLGFGAAAVAAVAGLGELARETAEAAVHTEHLAERVGLSTEALQELEYAARLNGVDFENMVDGLRFLNRATQEAKEGSEEAAQAFRKLHIDPHALKDPDASLMEVAKHFVNLKDQGEKTRVAMTLFGRAGANLIPMLNRGAAGISELRKRAHELGIVMDSETIEAGKKFDESLADLGFSLRGLKYAIGGPLISTFGRLLKIVTPIVIEFQKWIKPKVKEWLEAVSGAADTLSTHLAELRFVLLTVLATFAAYSLGLTTLTAESLALAAAQLTWGSAALIAGIRAAAGWVLALAPILVLAAAIGAVILIWDDVITALEGGDSLIMRISKEWDSMLKIDPKDSTIIVVLKTIADWLGTIINLMNPFHVLVDSIQKIKDVFDGDKWASEWRKTTDFFKGVQIQGPSVGWTAPQPGHGEGIFKEAYDASSGPSVRMGHANSSQVNHIEIHVPPGADGAAIGNAVSDTLDRQWDRKLAHAHAAADGG